MAPKVYSAQAKSVKICPYLYFDWPWEVTDVYIEGDVGIAVKTELLAWETVSVLFNVGLGHNWDLFPRDGPSCKEKIMR